MRLTFAKYRNKLYAGNSLTCLAWAIDKCKDNNLVIPVYSVRPGSSEAKLITEVDRKGIRLIPKGTCARIRKGAQWQSL